MIDDKKGMDEDRYIDGWRVLPSLVLDASETEPQIIRLIKQLKAQKIISKLNSPECIKKIYD